MQSTNPGSRGCGVSKGTYGLLQHTFRESLNVVADNESRHTFYDTEWKLGPAVFKRVSAFWGKPSIDLFASRLNFQLKPFVSWKPDKT